MSCCLSFSDFIKGLEHLTALSKTHYIGQYNSLEKLLKTENLCKLCYDNMVMVLDSLETKFKDKEVQMGISSYKKKLDVLKWVNKYIQKELIESFRDHGNSFIKKGQDMSVMYSEMETAIKSFQERLKKITDNDKAIDAKLKVAWEKIQLNKNNPQPNEKQSERQSYKLTDIQKEWFKIYEEKWRKPILQPLFNTFKNCGNLQEQCVKDEILSFKKQFIKFIGKEGKIKRTKDLMELEGCLLYGLYITAPPRRAKDFQSMKTIVFLGNNEHASTLYDPRMWRTFFKDITRPHINLYDPVEEEVIFTDYKTSKLYGDKIWGLRDFLEEGKESWRVEGSPFDPSDMFKEIMFNLWLIRNLCNHIAYNEKKISQYQSFPRFRYDKLFVETNLGHRLRVWAGEFIFGGYEKSTSINDLRHIYINNFYKGKKRTDLERVKLSNYMGHSLTEQNLYKKDVSIDNLT